MKPERLERQEMGNERETRNPASNGKIVVDFRRGRRLGRRRNRTVGERGGRRQRRRRQQRRLRHDGQVSENKGHTKTRWLRRYFHIFLETW
jgi:hypothetical protein